MQRSLAWAITMAFLGSMVAPSLCVLQFQMRRAYVERELCVQRDVVEAMRTCHGQCHLSKQLKALEQEAAAGFPADQLQFRTEPAMAIQVQPAGFVLAASPLGFPRSINRLCAGHADSADPVPWV